MCKAFWTITTAGNRCSKKKDLWLYTKETLVCHLLSKINALVYTLQCRGGKVAESSLKAFVKISLTNLRHIRFCGDTSQAYLKIWACFSVLEYMHSDFGEYNSELDAKSPMAILLLFSFCRWSRIRHASCDLESSIGVAEHMTIEREKLTYYCRWHHP